MRRRLLIVDHTLVDFERSRVALARRARASGFDVSVALPEASSRANGFDVHTFHLARCSTSVRDELRTLATLAEVYARVRPSLVHHFGVKPTLYGSIAARLTGIRWVVSTFTGLGHVFRDDAPRVTRALAIAGLRVGLRSRSNHIVCQIQEDIDVLLRCGIGARGRVRLIEGLGVDLERFHATPEPSTTPTILMAGRLLAEKGVHDYVRAANILRGRGVRARFVLLGAAEPEHPSTIPTACLSAWTREGSIEWLGWKHDMPRWFAESHVICLPTSYGEGIPRVLLEGSASARAIVASDLPGCRRVVRHGDTGLLVRAGDPEQLADALETLVGDAALRLRMGAAGRRRTAALFDESAIATKYLALYDELKVARA